ncbi:MULTISPECIES: nucleoside triphosphate hydrolase [unclassified Meridianimarinicoccus]|uniref:nucleoside triphosphate hydrolase n=1 Tax=unclassified Meridianimarinicoccus TaxID=2923344 RepID=UPI001868F0AD|nr:nucleoside triphosphate hydrolase [Fluviibacterium sp. MJW13]
MSPSPRDLAQTIANRLPTPARAQRLLVAIAGPPASGKSTVSEALVDHLGPEAILVPMDGFHLDNRVLERRGLLPRKGAPETFDAAGFCHAIGRLKTEPSVILPSFDRSRDLSVAGAIEVEPQHRIAVVEGNYLLFDADPWRALTDLWDFSVWTAPDEAVLRTRLITRWRDHGLAPDAAEARAEANDLPNARRTLASRLPADLVV